MADKIHLSVVTPEGVQLDVQVDELTAPSVQGQFGVLPGHRPLLAGLRTGLLKYRIDREETVVAIGPGFAKVADDSVNVLAERFIDKSAVDAVVARKELKDAQDNLAALAIDAHETEVTALVAALRWAAVRLELYGDPPPATLMLAHEMRVISQEEYLKARDEGVADKAGES